MTHEQLARFPIVVELPIQWGEMDAYGHVNNTVFFRFFESARIAFLDRCGFLRAYNELKVGPILHSTACRFRRPLFYPDTISVGARTSEVSLDRFVMEYKIVSHSQNEVVAEGDGVVVSFDYNKGSKSDLPEMVRKGLAGLQAE